jgi:hypothetical protein
MQELFRPGTFLNALRQLTARRMRAAGTAVALDSLKLVSTWDKAALASAAIAVPISGLMLQVRGRALGAAGSDL